MLHKQQAVTQGKIQHGENFDVLPPKKLMSADVAFLPTGYAPHGVPSMGNVSLYPVHIPWVWVLVPMQL